MVFADHPGGARPVLYDHRLAPGVGEFLGNQASRDVGGAAWRKRHHQSDGLIGIGLRGHRDMAECGQQRQGEDPSHVNSRGSHFRVRFAHLLVDPGRLSPGPQHSGHATRLVVSEMV